MEFDFTKSSTLKEVARAIRIHNHIHNKAERNAVLIIEYLNFAANLIDLLADDKIAAVKHGQWEDCSNGWMCSECNRDSSKDYRFCPHCGAKMNGGTGNGGFD